MNTIFIDGGAGTTGLEIRERLAGRADLCLITLSEAERKEPGARRAALNAADVVILCLPDDAAREAVALIDNPHTRVIDASTAHRTAHAWVYGFAEFEPEQAGRIAEARFVTNPGCYPTGFLALLRPLVRAGLLPTDYPYTVNAVSGYSGGGKSMIGEFEGGGGSAFRTYALGLAHKHVAEMRHHAGLVHAPLFAPAVGRFYRGMLVEVPLQLRALAGKPSGADLRAALAQAYAGCALVEVAAAEASAAMATLDAEVLAGTDRLKLFVFANEAAGQARLVAALDNLGKGAAGAAVQNLNLMLGLPESEGLR